MAEHDSHPGRSAKLAVVALIAAVILAAAVGGFVGAIVLKGSTRIEKTQDFATALRNGLVESCEENGNSVREILRGQIERNLDRTTDAEVRRFFPDVPRDELHALLKKSREEAQEEIDALAPVDCKAQYPSP